VLDSLSGVSAPKKVPKTASPGFNEFRKQARRSANSPAVGNWTKCAAMMRRGSRRVIPGDGLSFAECQSDAVRLGLNHVDSAFPPRQSDPRRHRSLPARVPEHGASRLLRFDRASRRVGPLCQRRRSESTCGSRQPTGIRSGSASSLGSVWNPCSPSKESSKNGSVPHYLRTSRIV
jgi:hypothetical protein